MKISAVYQEGTLVIQKTDDDQQVYTWSKKIEDFVLRRNENTGLTVDKENQSKVFLWEPIGDNFLVVFPRGGTVRCSYTPLNGAYLKLLDRVCEVVSMSLTKKGLSIELCSAIINRMGLQVSGGRLRIGERAYRDYAIPVIKGGANQVTRDNPKFVKKFFFPIEELTKDMEETTSRVMVEVHVDGHDIHFPIKTDLPEGEEAKYMHVPLECFYYHDHAVQLKQTGVGNVLFNCRPMEPAEKTWGFRFWESRFISGKLYAWGKKAKKKSSQKVSLFYEKFCQKAEEGTYEIFELAQKRNPKGAYFVIDKHAPDYQRIKHNPNVVKQYSPKYYRLLFRANSYISTETPVHLNNLRSNNKYFRRTLAENDFVFLQHGITYLKYQGQNSVYVVGKELSPSYIIVSSEKEKEIIHQMMLIPEEKILKTGMAIFSKIDYKHITQKSDDIAVIMLTWKPYEEDLLDFTKSSYYDNTVQIFALLQKYLPKENIIIVIHPKTGALLENTPLSSNIWRGPISEVLCKAKLLITDYSSVCYNSFYQGGGVVFYQEDLDYYEKENGKLIPKEDEYIGKRAFSLEELEEIIQNGIKDQTILLDRFRTKEHEERYQQINEFSDGKNMERICKKLEELQLI